MGEREGKASARQGGWVGGGKRQGGGCEARVEGVRLCRRRSVVQVGGWVAMGWAGLEPAG